MALAKCAGAEKRAHTVAEAAEAPDVEVGHMMAVSVRRSETFGGESLPGRMNRAEPDTDAGQGVLQWLASLHPAPAAMFNGRRLISRMIARVSIRKEQPRPGDSIAASATPVEDQLIDCCRRARGCHDIETRKACD